MNNPIQTLMSMLISRNPQMANNPQAQEMLQVIQNGDSVRGEEIARNLCKSYGTTPEQAVGEARKFFNI